MRIVWWSVAALTLLAVAGAFRTSQVEGATRISRRIPTSANNEKTEDTSQASSPKPTFRSRTSRRRDDFSTRDVNIRTKSRSQDKTDVLTDPPQIVTRNERLNLRRTLSRSRGRTTENESSTTASSRAAAIRSRTRQDNRRSTTSTLPPSEIASQSTEKIAEINTKVENKTKTVVVEEQKNDINQLGRRSSIIPTSERTILQKRIRGRINTRPNARSLDLEISGTTNTFINVEKEPTTAKAGDLRSSRKLKYKSRLSDTDTNLTGDGIKALSESTKSSQNDVTSQSGTQPSPIQVEENAILENSDALPTKTTTPKVTRVLRRPVQRGKVSFQPSLPISAVKVSDEINEDDNYPESFKALIQTKAVPHIHEFHNYWFYIKFFRHKRTSPPSESLSVKASQKVYKTYTSSAQSTNTGSATNKYSRVNKQLAAEKKEHNEEISTSAPPLSVSESSKSKIQESSTRVKFTPRNRKLPPFNVSQ
ncbi:hypothetical protein ACJJTC_016357 [Scirpophaga incertulas]